MWCDVVWCGVVWYTSYNLETSVDRIVKSNNFSFRKKAVFFFLYFWITDSMQTVCHEMMSIWNIHKSYYFGRKTAIIIKFENKTYVFAKYARDTARHSLDARTGYDK